MTVMSIPAVDITAESERLIEGLETFLADPIGYGAYDPSDPITLEEFCHTRHHRGVYAAPLAF